MPFSVADQGLLMQAVERARLSVGLSDPNPRVGCVIHDASGIPAGAGHTQQAGSAHAEVMALREATARGVDVKGGTAWVTLEPCSHHGRTPPCCEALLSACIARVVIGAADPFALVAGRGIARLREAGVVVDLAPPCPAVQAAHELNIGYFSRMLRQRPWVRVKIAASLDGRTALLNGVSQWITAEPARLDGHRWRQRAGAVLTGVGTVITDDPALNVRGLPCQRQPLRVIVDSNLRTPKSAKILQPVNESLIIHAGAAVDHLASLEAAGIALMGLPAHDGRVDLPELIAYLSRLEVNEIHVEAGATLNAALLEADLVDELLIYFAPKLLGPGRDMFALPELMSLQSLRAFEFTDVQLIGPDVRLLARLPGRGAFASRV